MSYWLVIKNALIEGDWSFLRSLPEIQMMYGIPQPEKHHPEGCVQTHMYMVMQWVFENTDDIFVRFGALVHDFGKVLTPEDEWPKHHNHEKLGLEVITKFCDRNNVPDNFREFALTCSKHHTDRHRCREMKSGKLARFLIETLRVRSPADDTFDRFMLVCDADARGRGGDYPTREMPEREYMLQCAEAVRSTKNRNTNNPQVLIGDCAAAINKLKGE